MLPVALALAGLSGCGSGGSSASTTSSAATGGEAKEATVFAAASLTEPFTDLGKIFETAHPGTTVRFNSGSSATLAQQIVQGAPADVFAAASPATMKMVTGASLASSPAVFV